MHGLTIDPAGSGAGNSTLHLSSVHCECYQQREELRAALEAARGEIERLRQHNEWGESCAQSLRDSGVVMASRIGTMDAELQKARARIAELEGTR